MEGAMDGRGIGQHEKEGRMVDGLREMGLVKRVCRDRCRGDLPECARMRSQ